MSEISRNIFNAVDMLVDKKLSNYKADLTASYVICDNSRAAEGIYTVSNNKDKGTVSFMVYKQTTDNYTYKIGDSVYILIPGGDYKEKKFIMGLENEIKDRIVPEQKEVPTHFISLGDSYTPETGELPVTLILNSDTKSHQISQKELAAPRVLVNYKKIRISATFNVNLDTKMAVDLNSSSYAIKFIAHDSSNDRDFIYTLSSNDILSNLYYFGNEYYTFTKDIDIDIENFSVSKYTLLLEQTGTLTNLEGKPDNIKGKIILKNVNVSFGCLSSEYQDEIFAYTENNIKTFTDNINLSIGVKINRDEKEVNTLKDFFGTNKDGLIYWEQLINGVWYPYKSDIKNFITSIDITNDIVNLTLRSCIGIRIENKIEVWNTKYSNSLSLDNSLKTQYNYNIRIFSEHGNFLRKTDTTTLTVKLYQNNKEIELGENKYNFTTSENIIKELKYYWYKDNELIKDKNSFSLTVEGADISVGDGTNYSCKLEIGQTDGTETFQSQNEAYDTLTLRTYEEPKETALYEIVPAYEEVGVSYWSGEESKSIQYFPSDGIPFTLYEMIGQSRNQRTKLNKEEELVCETQEIDGEGKWQTLGNEEVFTGALQNNVTISIENIKFNKEIEYNGYKDYKRRIVVEWRKYTYLKWEPIDLNSWDANKSNLYEDKDEIYIKTADTEYVEGKNYYKRESGTILAEKNIYLVLAKGNILANFETTAFGFNDLTQDGTKGIKFEAAGGMNFYAGDAKGQGAEKNIITIWSGNANGIEGNPTNHGEKVFYVTSEGNVELNNANIRGNLVSKKETTVDKPYIPDKEVNSIWTFYCFDYDYIEDSNGNKLYRHLLQSSNNLESNIFNENFELKLNFKFISLSFKTNSFYLLRGKDYFYSKLTTKPNNWETEYTNYFTVDKASYPLNYMKPIPKQSIAPNFYAEGQEYYKERFDNASASTKQKSKIEMDIFFYDEQQSLLGGITIPGIEQNSSYSFNIYENFEVNTNNPYISHDKDEVIALIKSYKIIVRSQYIFDLNGQYLNAAYILDETTGNWENSSVMTQSGEKADKWVIQNIFEELSFQEPTYSLTNNLSFMNKLYTNNLQVYNTAKIHYVQATNIDLTYGDIETNGGLQFRTNKAELEGLEYLYSFSLGYDLSFLTKGTNEYWFDISRADSLRLPIRNTQYEYKETEVPNPKDETKNIKVVQDPKVDSLYQNKIFNILLVEPYEKWKDYNYFGQNKPQKGFATDLYHDKNNFYYIQDNWNKYISETETALYGTLHTPKIDFDAGPSATGNISISGDGIQIIRGQIDSSGTVSTSAYIGNYYRDGFAKAPIQIKSYGTTIDDTYIPTLSFQDINDTSTNNNNENVQTFWTMGYRNNLKCFEILGVDMIGNGTEQGMGGIRIPKSMVDGRHVLNIDEFIYLKRKYCGGEVKLAAQSHQQFSTNPASLADPKDGLTPIAIAAEPSGDPGVIAHPNGWIHNSTNTEATIYGVFYYFLYVPSWLWYLEG